MTCGLRFLAFFSLWLLAAAQPTLAPAQTSASYAPRQLIVKVTAPADDVAALRASVQAVLKKRFESTGAELWELRGDDVADAIGRLKNDARVGYVEPNYIVRAHDVLPNDPRLAQQWALHNTGRPAGRAAETLLPRNSWNSASNPEI